MEPEQTIIEKNRKWHQKLFSFWLFQEFFIINKLAWPSAIAAFGGQMIPLVSMMFVGHLGKGIYLDGAALALSFANVTGTSIVYGFSAGMDTLCSQAYGAKNLRLVGVYFQRAIILSLLVCFPIWAVWLNAEEILVLLHQDAGVASIAGKYLVILCTGKPAVVIFTLSLKFLQTQNVVIPTIFITILGNLLNIGCQYLFVIYLHLGVEGSAISVSITYWSLAIMYILYIRCSSLYYSAWPGCTLDAFRGWLHYCKYGIPGMIMMCLEWWTFEIGYLIIGATSAQPKIEIGIYSIMFNVSSQLFSIPIGFAVAATVRVGNLLGANNPELAQKVSYLSLFIITVIGLNFSGGVFLFKSHIPFIFTQDECIINGAASTLFIIAIYENFDGFQLMASGILKGCGKQNIAAVINVLAYQLIAIPLAVCLSVVLKMDTKGYWIGIASAISIQAIIFLLLVICLNWKKVALTAQENASLTQTKSNKVHSYYQTIPTSDHIRDSNYPKSIQDCESGSLLVSSSTQNLIRAGRNSIWCRELFKLALFALFISSFAVGLAFYLNNSNPTKLFSPVQYDNDSLNFNPTGICPY